MSYCCLGHKDYHQGDYRLTALREQDMLLIKNWRNAQINFLRQGAPLSDEDQKQYFWDVVYPTFALPLPPLLLFSYLYADTCIGYGGLTNIYWSARRAEISFLVDPHRVEDPDLYRLDFSTFLDIIKKIAFGELKLNRLFTETYNLRPLHLEILELSGFRQEGRLKKHVFKNNNYVDAIIHGFLREYYHG